MSGTVKTTRNTGISEQAASLLNAVRENTQYGEVGALSKSVRKGLLQFPGLCEVIWGGFQEAGLCSIPDAK